MTEPNGAPTPGTADSGIPLVQGVDASWNDILSVVPEDKRAEIGKSLQERISSYADLEPYRELAKNGIPYEDIEQALTVTDAVTNQPQLVYERLGQYLQQAGMTPKEAKEAVEEVKETQETGEEPEIFKHPAYQRLQQQVETMAQIMLANKTEQDKTEKEKAEDAAVAEELENLKKTYGNFPEDEITMRMYAKGLSAEDAYKEYYSRMHPGSPYLLGSGGAVPRNHVDPKKLDAKGTKDLVAQMLAHTTEG